MNFFTNKLYQSALCFIKIFSLILLFLLFTGSFLMTCYTNDMNTQEVLTKWDNPLLSIPLTIIIAVIFTKAALSICSKPAKYKNCLLCATCFWIFLTGCILILFGKAAPFADSMSVYSAAELLASDDISVIHPTDSYFSYYPQQVGLMAFLEILFRFWNLFGLSLPAYHFIKGVYVVLLCVAVFFQYQSVHMLWESDKADCLYLLLAGSNLPMIMYSSFIYGEIPSFAAFSVGLYFLLRFLSKQSSITANTADHTVHPDLHGTIFHIASCILSLAFFTLSVMLRKNTLILIIAVLLVTGLEWLKQKKPALLIFTIVCAFMSVLILPVTERIYEYRAGNTLGSGVTAMSYFAMGMQESSRANGWYNGFNFNTYQETGMNPKLADEISKQAIQERLDYFKENPAYAISFYTGKHLSQWTDGTYASRQATISNFGGRHPLFDSVYEGNLGNIFISYCNLYQNILYLGALLFCFAGCCFQKFSFQTPKKEKYTLLTGLPVYIGLIGVVGGFLFHIMWEANSRYILVYGLLLLPYSARGLDLLSSKLFHSSKAQP